MNNFKRLLVAFLVLSVSLGVVFLPKLINNHSNRSLTGKTERWTYTDRVYSGITAQQVASLYCEGELDNIYSESTFLDTNADEQAELRQSSLSVFDNVFSEGSYLAAFLKNELEQEKYAYFSKKSVLAVVDDHAVVLNLVSVSAERMTFIFEEKTKAVISFSFFSPTDNLMSAANVTEQEIENAVSRYYSALLKGTHYSHYFINRTNLGDEESEKYELRLTDFGLLKMAKEYDSEVILY
ncbi:MAG: hypothetical protein IJ426_06680 [Clostridia bacterium]|nr:hypothetical protein [Clostridia bacterium]